MAHRKLLEDVSMEELQQMRNDEGLSNYEIAERVGVCYATIHRILGPQPKGIRTPHGLQAAAKARAKEEHREEKAPPQKAAEEPQEACLMVESRVINLVGMTAQYEVHEQTKKVLVKRPDDIHFTLDMDEIDDFINELKAIRRNMDKPVPMEAW